MSSLRALYLKKIGSSVKILKFKGLEILKLKLKKFSLDFFSSIRISKLRIDIWEWHHPSLTDFRVFLRHRRSILSTFSFQIYEWFNFTLQHSNDGFEYIFQSNKKSDYRNICFLVYFNPCLVWSSSLIWCYCWRFNRFIDKNLFNYWKYFLKRKSFMTNTAWRIRWWIYNSRL